VATFRPLMASQMLPKSSSASSSRKVGNGKVEDDVWTYLFPSVICPGRPGAPAPKRSFRGAATSTLHLLADAEANTGLANTSRCRKKRAFSLAFSHP